MLSTRLSRIHSEAKSIAEEIRVNHITDERFRELVEMLAHRQMQLASALIDVEKLVDTINGTYEHKKLVLPPFPR